MNAEPLPKRPPRTEYLQRYYTVTRDYQLAKAKVRYQNNPEFKQRCKERDRKRRQYRASWDASKVNVSEDMGKLNNGLKTMFVDYGGDKVPVRVQTPWMKMPFEPGNSDTSG